MRQPDFPRALRIAVISPPFVTVPPTQYGGTELVIGELLDGLINRGHQVTLFSTKNSKGGFRYRARVQAYFPSPVWPPSSSVELQHCAFVIRQILQNPNQFDVIHTHCNGFLHWAPLVSIPIISTLHQVSHHLLRQLCRLYPQVTYVCISHRQQELSGPFPRCTVVYHGLDPSRYQVSTTRNYVAFLGRLSEVKAPHIAIDIAQQSKMRIRIGGRPHEEDLKYFQNEVLPRLQRPHVEYLGELSHGPKVKLLSSAKALLFPIIWEEPFGLVAIEAMLCGCPVITFNRGSMPELIDQGITGFIAQDFPDMVHILTNHIDGFNRQHCRDHAAKRFGCNTMVERYIETYLNALLHKPELGHNLECSVQLSTDLPLQHHTD